MIQELVLDLEDQPWSFLDGLGPVNSRSSLRTSQDCCEDHPVRMYVYHPELLGGRVDN